MTTLRGSCLCGGVKFEISDAPETLRYCHCESCKKLSGGAATVNARVPSSSIRILEGQELPQTYQPAEGSAKTFCLSCGSNLFGGDLPCPALQRSQRASCSSFLAKSGSAGCLSSEGFTLPQVWCEPASAFSP